MKKQYFLTADTETTMKGRVSDFGAAITDRKGNIVAQCGILVAGVHDDTEDELFYSRDAGELWKKSGIAGRRENYSKMLDTGARMMSTPAAINRWLTQAVKAYNPVLTAYNLAFDVGKCRNTGIDLDQFADRKFCLWHSAVARWGQSKAYRQFVLDHHFFNSPTKHGNASYKTNAEVMAKFVLGEPELPDEPHTALEDVLEYEVPILTRLLKGYSVKKCMSSPPFNWRNHQLKDAFTAK